MYFDQSKPNNFMNERIPKSLETNKRKTKRK